ncbi:MAG: aldehyde dehydrogenase [Herbaspirillum sp.]|nr:aldehyde dehydrogenase [Herbaspirillum sp.]
MSTNTTASPTATIAAQAVHQYPDVLMLIDGQWQAAASGRTLPISDPATGETIGTIPHAGFDDLDRALQAAQRGFDTWRNTGVFERSKIMRRAAQLLRERVERIGWLMTREQGKPLIEARMEVLAAADIIDWFAEEARRTYGRIVPARVPQVYQLVIKEPVGPVAAFTPWNFPINQVVRKLSAALAAGCSMIVKAAEETPAAPAELIRAFVDAGLPAGVVNLVYGVPADISSYLIASPTIRKISFTGSTAVGKQLAALAGTHMKRATMELGGHGPALIFDDADIDAAVRNLAAGKFRNAGQVCVAPTRFMVQRNVFDRFVEQFVATAAKVKVGNGLDTDSTMGPLANPRRMRAMIELIDDALACGARLKLGGQRIGSVGNFFAPTVLTEVPLNARAMNEEPFGPLALINPFDDPEQAIAEANRLPYGLAAYAYTRSASLMHALSNRIESGMLTINHSGLGFPEVPFGGIKDSGYGSEGGSEAVEAYLNTKFVSQLHR